MRAPQALIIGIMRNWRSAVDHRQPVLPTIIARSNVWQTALLAPAVDALLKLLEAWRGRRFESGLDSDPELTGDERELLRLLEIGVPPALAPSSPLLTEVLRVALVSTAILLRGWLFAGSPEETSPVHSRRGTASCECR